MKITNANLEEVISQVNVVVDVEEAEVTTDTNNMSAGRRCTGYKLYFEHKNTQ